MTRNNRFSPAFQKGHFNSLVDDGKYLRQGSLYKQILPRPVRRSFSEGGTPSRLKTSMISVDPVILSISSSCPSCASWLKNPFNQRNPRLINDLRLRKITYEKINLFLQNEPNFRKSQVNVTDLLKRNYEQMDTWSIRKNEPNTNPNEPKTNPILANKTHIRTQTNPKRTQFPNLPRQHFLMAISGKNKYAHIVDNCGNRVRNNYRKGHIMTYLPIAILAINFCCFLFDLIFPSNKYWKTHFLKLPVLLQKLFVFITVGPLFIAPVIPQSRFNISPYFSLPAGIFLFALGWIIIIFAFLKIGFIPAIRKKSDLITSGIYSFIRHPIYSGTLISVLGWSILFKSIISMIYFPLLCLLYIVATILEEKGLIEEYGQEYINYKKKVTKRLIPFIF